MTHCNSVLRVNAVEEREDYRKAVADILLNIQNDHKVTLHEIAERTDISIGTISNAANKKADLSPTFLRRLGILFGPHTLDPYHRLYGARGVPIEQDGDADILPLLLIAGQQIATARTAASPGGVVETLREKLGYLPDLRRLRRETDALIARIESEAA